MLRAALSPFTATALTGLLESGATRLKVTGLNGCVWVFGPVRERLRTQVAADAGGSRGNTTRTRVMWARQRQRQQSGLGAVAGDVTSVYAARFVSWGFCQAVSCLRDNFIFF